MSHKIRIDKEQVLLGSLLGDGAIGYPTKCSKNPRFEESHSLNQRDYLLWKQLFLSFDTTYYEYQYQNKKTKKTYPNCRIYSSCIPMLEKYHKWKYKGGISEIITRLNIFGLLIWYLDDGNYGYSSKDSTFCTEDFSYSTHLLMQSWFRNEHEIEVEIYGGKKRRREYLELHLIRKETEKLLWLFQPYISLIPQSIHYKFGLDENRRENAIATSKKYRKEHKEENSAYHKEYRKEHRKERLVYDKKYYQIYREKRLVYFKKYHQEHREEYLAYGKEYRQQHREEINKKQRERRHCPEINKN